MKATLQTAAVLQGGLFSRVRLKKSCVDRKSGVLGGREIILVRGGAKDSHQSNNAGALNSGRQETNNKQRDKKKKSQMKGRRGQLSLARKRKRKKINETTEIPEQRSPC